MNNRYINPSGFYENLPQEQVVEDSLKTKIQKVAEAHGYSRLETASVEYMETLASKGDVDKEIYTIGRALAEGEHTESERGLHFDLTVPFARYVAQHQGDLVFPYRRYQIQKVWRGERPQKGRFREFYQADVDVVARENLPLAFDAEIALVMAKALDSFDVGAITMHINNRKFLNGLFDALGIDGHEEALQAIDKLDKVGKGEVKRMLVEEQGNDATNIDVLLDLITKKVPAKEVGSFLEGVTQTNELLDEGKAELQEVFAILSASATFKNVSFVWSPSIARGLDYYTGTVYETTIDGLEKYGSICSGGRYADLAGRFTNQKLPGAGLSIGLTRLLSILKEEKLANFDKKTTSDMTICLLDKNQMTTSLKTAEALREVGLNVEVNYKDSVALGKQLTQVEEKGISFALVCELDGKFTLFNVSEGEKQMFDTETTLTQYFADKGTEPEEPGFLGKVFGW